MNKFIDNAVADPKSIFLLDGIGALISAFMLGVVLVYFENYIGMPRLFLYILAFFPLLFLLYDFYCYKFVKAKFNNFIFIIATLNIGYCLFSFVMLFIHAPYLTSLGWIYFIGELLILIVLIYFELKVARRV